MWEMWEMWEFFIKCGQNCENVGNVGPLGTLYISGIEFKDFILGFRQSTFPCTTLKCIQKFRIPFIKSGIPASNLGSSEARNPAKFAACISTEH